MPKLGRILMLVSAGFLLLPLPARGQDSTSPSLGDASRQARQPKPTDGPAAQSPKPSKVISDDDAPTSAPAQVSRGGDQRQSGQSSATPRHSPTLSAEKWKAQILAQKNLIQSTQTRIDSLSQSIHFSSSSSHVQWNERQREKQQEVDRLQGQLAEQKKRLEEMQESARKQGYGNAVYDP